MNDDAEKAAFDQWVEAYTETWGEPPVPDSTLAWHFGYLAGKVAAAEKAPDPQERKG